MSLQVVAITGWAGSMLLNPEIGAPLNPANGAMLLALIGTCLWKGRTASIQAWRAGTILYAFLLALAFRMELDLMGRQSELFALPLAILTTVGFSGVIPLRRDYLLIAVLMWALFVVGNSHFLPVGMDAELVVTLLLSTVLVGIGLNHAIVSNLRVTFKLKEDFRYLSETDVLTHLPNRRTLMAQLEIACGKSEQHCWHFALLDIDDFKSVNDRSGHHVGDKVLVALADEFRKLPPNVSIGRLGGEEFGVVVHGFAHDDMQVMLEQLLGDVRKRHVSGNTVSFSAGFVRIQPQEKVIDVLRRADEALYVAKHSGKARVIWQPAAEAA